MRRVGGTPRCSHRAPHPSCLFAGSIYRRGARRWRKLYRVNGHIFQAKRFNRVSKIQKEADGWFGNDPWGEAPRLLAEMIELMREIQFLPFRNQWLFSWLPFATDNAAH